MDAGFGAELPAEIAMMFGIVALVGEHGPDPRHDGEGGQEQPLEHQSVIDVRRGGRTGDRHAGARDGVLGAPLASISRIGASQIATALGPHRARIEDQGRVAAQHADQDAMNLRQHTDARPLLQMAAQSRTADLAGGRRQAAPRRAFPEELSQRGHHPNRCRSGMTTTSLLRWRTEIDDCRNQVQIPEIHCFLPCLTRQTWSFQINNAPYRCCITAILSNQSARDPTTHGISGNCLLRPAGFWGNAPSAIATRSSSASWTRSTTI